MSRHESVTFFIRELQRGKRDNAECVWEHFYRRLLPLARKHLNPRVRRVIDEEDVVVRAMDECFRRLEAGKVPFINDRGNLWALLATITKRRALNANRDMMCEKQGGGKVRGHSVFIKPDNSLANGFEQVEGVELSPELAATIAEQLQRHMSVLTPEQYVVAKLKQQGFSDREIAANVGCSVATVERRLNRIRSRWSKLEQQDTEEK